MSPRPRSGRGYGITNLPSPAQRERVRHNKSPLARAAGEGPGVRVYPQEIQKLRPRSPPVFWGIDPARSCSCSADSAATDASERQIVNCWTTGEIHAAGPATLSIINVGRWDARALARFRRETPPPLVAKRAGSVEDGALPRPGRPSLACASGLDERLRAGMRRPFTVNQGREDWWGSLRSTHPTCSGFRRGRAQCPKPRPSLRSGTCHQLRASAVNYAPRSQNPRAARMSSKSRRW
jgi:hypothetical protein